MPSCKPSPSTIRAMAPLGASATSTSSPAPNSRKPCRTTTSSSSGGKTCRSWFSKFEGACALLQQILLQKLHRRVKLKVLIHLFPKGVPFVLRHQIPDRRSLLFQRAENLLRFPHRHSRIVLSGHNHHRLLDLLDVVHRRDFFQKFTHLRIALIAILDATQIP